MESEERREAKQRRVIGTRDTRRSQCVLLDWGDTVMRVFPNYPGPMESWPAVEAVPGVARAIRQIRCGSLVCLATNAADSNERAIYAALARVELGRLFDHVFCFDTVGHRKPSSQYFTAILDRLDLPADKVFMVGDDFEVDVLGATAVGIRSVWLNRLTCESRKGALHTTAHSLDALHESLEGLGFVRE